MYLLSLIFQFPKGDIPVWVQDALKVAGINIQS
jgi:hypothetical protein